MKIQLSALLVVAVAASASATTFTLQGLALSSPIVSLAGPAPILTGLPVYAGPEKASIDGSLTTTRLFCVDLAHYSNGATTTVSLFDTSTGSGGLQKAAQLYNHFSMSVGDDTTKNAALQVAIWRAVFPALTVNDGGQGIDSLATTYLGTDLSGDSNVAAYYYAGSANQSMLGGVGGAGEPDGNNLSPVPEPASMLALGLGAVGVLRRRKRSA